MEIFDKFSMTGKTSVITGGASGLGKQMADALAQAGSDIVLAQRSLEPVQELARTLSERYGVRAIAVQCDVSSQKDVQLLVDTAMHSFGKIDVLINNAGIIKIGDTAAMPAQDWQKVLDTNLNGTFYCSQAVGRVMINQRRGSIINIASMSGLIVNSPQPAASYCVSKAAIIQLTKCLAAEWALHNIRVNAVAPGYFKTEITKKSIEAGGPKIERWLSLTPMNRFGSPPEIEGIILYLASEASTFATGGVFVIDGGYTAW